MDGGGLHYPEGPGLLPADFTLFLKSTGTGSTHHHLWPRPGHGSRFL